jgi:putative spermidine/putrescine transport system substrate-binding protein
LLAGMGAVGTTALIGGRAAAQQSWKGKSLRFLTWDDSEGRAIAKEIAGPFGVQTGVKVIPDLVGVTSLMVSKVKASRAKPQYDVVIFVSYGAGVLSGEGLLEKPDLSKIPNLSHIPPELHTLANGYALSFMGDTSGMVYNKQAFPTPPDSWEILWDKKYSGKIFLPPPTEREALQLIVLAARMAGGSAHDPEPGFKKLAELKGRVLTLGEDKHQLAELFRTGALAAGGPSSPSDLADYYFKPEYGLGMALVELKEGFPFDLECLAIIKGHPGDTDVIHGFLNTALSAESEGKIAQLALVTPMNRDAVLPPQLKNSSFMVGADATAKKGIRIDPIYLASVRDEWAKRYTEIFGK